MAEPIWQKFGGCYRLVDDIRVPWIPSPIVSHPPDALLPLIDSTVQSPFIPPFDVYSVKSSRFRPKWRYFRKGIGDFFHRVGNRERDDYEQHHPEPLDRWSHLDRQESLSTERTLVDDSEWKNWGYWARPRLHGLPFTIPNRSWEEGSNTPTEAENIFDSLISPSGSPRPSNWQVPLSHTGIPRRPSRWLPISPTDPLPFPFECQLNPFLVHRPRGEEVIRWYIQREIPSILYELTEATIPLSRADWEQPATFPLLTHMYISGIYTQTQNHRIRFPWPFMIQSRDRGTGRGRGDYGIAVYDVIQTIFKNFDEFVSNQEFMEWSFNRQTIAQVAYRKRIEWTRAINGAPGTDEYMKRIDYLGPMAHFRGLEPMENAEGWLLFIATE